MSYNNESFASIRAEIWRVPMGSLALLGSLGPLEPLGSWTPETPGTPEIPSSSGPEVGVVASFCVSN